MPADKNQFLRYKELDRIFKDFHHMYDRDEIIKIVSQNVTLADGTPYKYNPSTFRKDKEDMKSLIPRGLRIEKKSMGEHKMYYRYSNKYQSMFQNELEADEVAELQNAVLSLSKFRGVEGYGWLDKVLLRFEEKLGLPHDNRDRERILFEGNDRLTNIMSVNFFINATVHSHPLRLVYKPFDREEITWTFHPWHMRQFNNRWFIFGWADEEDKMCNVALDRIVKYEEINVSFHRNRGTVDFSTYFNDIVGVTIPRYPQTDIICETEEIILQFSPRRFHYVKTKPIHRSQICDEENCTATLNVKVNRELIAKVLSFGSDVKVLKGDFLRKKIIENAKKTLEQYVDDQNVDV